MNQVMIPGLDGSTPLGFLAGLGLLQVVQERWPGAKLGWNHNAARTPYLVGDFDQDQVLSAVYADAAPEQARWPQAHIFELNYPKLEKGGTKMVQKLEPPLPIFRAWLGRSLAVAAPQTPAHRTLEYASALMCESVNDFRKVDKVPGPELVAEWVTGVTPEDLTPYPKVTFFDFTARNTQFLGQVDVIRRALTPELVADRLLRGLDAAQDIAKMCWDAAATPPAALYRGTGRGSPVVAEWLAFRGLVSFPLVDVGGRAVTTACTGRRKKGKLIWPLWTPAISLAVARSLLARGRLAALSTAEKNALGIFEVLQAGLITASDGYGGIFGPSTLALEDTQIDLPDGGDEANDDAD